MLVSVVNAKGGVGKTATSTYLAAAFAAEGKDVRAIDLDRQDTAIDWAERAEDTDEPLPFGVENTIPHRLDRIARLATTEEIIVVDTPPGDPEAIDTAIAAADFIVVPTRATNADLSRVWEVQTSLEGKRHGVLITFAGSGTSSYEEVAQQIMEAL